MPAMHIESCGRFFAHPRAFSNAPGPALCRVNLDPEQEFEPRLKSRQLPDGTLVSPNLEDMYPFLSAEELASNLLISDRE